MSALTPTNYFLVNTPRKWRSFYPNVDTARLGDRWIGFDYSFKNAKEDHWLERLSFFHYLHTMIWKDITSSEVTYRFTREQVHNHYQNTAGYKPLDLSRVLNAMYNFMDTEAGYPFIDDTPSIITDIINGRLSRYFLLLQMSDLPPLNEEVLLCLIFSCLVGHQFMYCERDDKYQHKPPSFKIVNQYGYAFDEPTNSLETTSLYPCGIKDGLMMFGSIEDTDNYIALYPQSAQVGKEK